MRQSRIFIVLTLLFFGEKWCCQIELSADLLDTVLTRYFIGHPVSEGHLYVDTFLNYRREGEESIDFIRTGRPTKIGNRKLSYLSWYDKPRPTFKDHKKGFKLLSFRGQDRRLNGDSLIIPLALYDCNITKADDVSHCVEPDQHHDTYVILIMNRQREYEFGGFIELDF